MNREALLQMKFMHAYLYLGVIAKKGGDRLIVAVARGVMPGAAVWVTSILGGGSNE